MNASPHPAASHHLPFFITAPGETDTLMVATGIFLLLAVVGFGLLFLRLHTLPERIAHRGHKLQFEIVAVLGLISLFTHMHIFWIIGLLLALVDLPDFSGYFGRIAGSVEKIAGVAPGQGDAGLTHGIGDELVPAAAAARDAHDLPGETLPKHGETLPKHGDGLPSPAKRPELATTGTRR
jgi:hypothetical protein